jgi:hypothetical protein
LVILAGLSGVQELFYLHSINEDISLFEVHYLFSYFISVGFIFILIIRLYLLKIFNGKLIIFYMILLTVLVMLNLLNNEYITYLLRGS